MWLNTFVTVNSVIIYKRGTFFWNVWKNLVYEDVISSRQSFIINHPLRMRSLDKGCQLNLYTLVSHNTVKLGEKDGILKIYWHWSPIGVKGWSETFVWKLLQRLYRFGLCVNTLMLYWMKLRKVLFVNTVHRIIFAQCNFCLSSLANSIAPSWIHQTQLSFKKDNFWD